MRRYGNEFKRNGELRLVLKKLQSDVEDQMRDIIDFSNVYVFIIISFLSSALLLKWQNNYN